MFLVPVAFDPRTADAFNLTKATALWVFTLAGAALWSVAVAFGPRVRKLPRSGLLALAAALVAATAMASALSGSRTLSMVGLYHRYGGFASIALYAALAALIAWMYAHRTHALREIAITVAAAAVVVSVYVVLQRAGVDPWNWRAGAEDLPTASIGNLGNSEFSGAYIGIALAFVVYFALFVRTLVMRVIAALSGSVMVVALLATGSRAGIVAAACGVAALFLFMTQLRTALKVAAVGVVLLGLALVPVALTRTTFSRSTGLFRTESVEYRAETWDAARRMFLERPIFGSGPETYFGNYPQYRSAADARDRGITIPDKPHNIFLEWAVSVGAVGLLLYLALAGRALWLVGERTNTVLGEVRPLTAAFGGAFVAYLVQGLFSIDVPPLAFMGWVLIGAVAAVAAYGRADARDADRPRSWTRLLAVAAVVVAAALIAVGLKPLRADHAVWAAARIDGGWSNEAIALHRKAIDLYPQEAAYRSLAGAYVERYASNEGAPMSREAALKQAAAFYEQAVRIQPSNLYFVLNAVRVYARLGRLENPTYYAAADRWLVRAVRLDPLDPQVRELHASVLSLWASKTNNSRARETLADRAREQLRRATALSEAQAE